MLWFFYALATAICWGLGYALTEKLLHNGVSPSVTLLMIVLLQVPVFLFLAINSGSIKPSIDVLSKDTNLLIIAIIMCVVFTLGNIFIMQAVGLKNASHVNLIEITYPIFTVLFTFLLFKTVHLNWASAFGGIMVISGAILMIYKG